jgi:glycosyltransferase involved in cell wall biosynthesis
MAQLPERNLSAVCLGRDNKGYQRELEALAAALGVSVTFIGLVDKEELNRYVNKSRIGVMCSVRDAAPRVVLEYMAANVPVLCSSELRAGTRYVGEEAGLVRAPEDFARGIEEILDHPERFSPRAYFLEHFSRERAVARFVALLREAGFPFEEGRALRTAQR